MEGVKKKKKKKNIISDNFLDKYYFFREVVFWVYESTQRIRKYL